MKILFVSGYDSMNYTLAECAKEAVRRGHEVLAVARDTADRANCGMYGRRGISAVSLDNFDFGLLDSVDIVITSPVKPYYYRKLFDEIHARGLFVIAFAALFSSVVMREYPDLVFCLGNAKIREFDRYALRYSCISIGNPQYDVLLDHRRKRNDDPESIKRVLIADQGGYPYGKEGKAQLAKTLKAIAENDPGRIYEIKQRYNGAKAASATHAISESLADYMADLPENLSFLETDKELEELMGGYDAMITTWSTAFIDAVVMNIPLVLISGLPSEDRFDVRRQRVNEAYEDLRNTGCVRDYLSLRHGRISFSYVDEAYRREILYDADSKSAPRIFNAAELLYEKIISRGLRINKVIRTDYEEFMNNPDAVDTVRADDPDYLLKRKYLISFNDLMQEWVYTNRCMGNVLKLDSLREFYEPEAEVDFDRELERAKEEFRKSGDVFFNSADAAVLIGSDRILQDFYFDRLYEKGMHEQLEKPDFAVLAPESRYYNLCLYELDQGRTGEGLEYLDAFLNIIYEGKSSDLLKYKRLAQSVLRVFKKTGIIRFGLFALRGHHQRMAEHFDRAMVTDHAVLSALLMHVFFKEKRFAECIEVYVSYIGKKNRRDKKKRTGLRKTADAAAGFFAHRMYKRSIKAAHRTGSGEINDEIIGIYDKSGQRGFDCT